MGTSGLFFSCSGWRDIPGIKCMCQHPTYSHPAIPQVRCFVDHQYWIQEKRRDTIIAWKSNVWTSNILGSRVLSSSGQGPYNFTRCSQEKYWVAPTASSCKFASVFFWPFLQIVAQDVRPSASFTYKCWHIQTDQELEKTVRMQSTYLYHIGWYHSK